MQFFYASCHRRGKNKRVDVGRFGSPSMIVWSLLASPGITAENHQSHLVNHWASFPPGGPKLLLRWAISFPTYLPGWRFPMLGLLKESAQGCLKQWLVFKKSNSCLGESVQRANLPRSRDEKRKAHRCTALPGAEVGKDRAGASYGPLMPCSSHHISLSLFYSPSVWHVRGLFSSLHFGKIYYRASLSSCFILKSKV